MYVWMNGGIECGETRRGKNGIKYQANDARRRTKVAKEKVKEKLKNNT